MGGKNNNSEMSRMSEIQLLYVTNETLRKKGAQQQELRFFIRVENLAFKKCVEVVWAGEDGQWKTLPARFHSSTAKNQEYWQAKARFTSNTGKLPGDIQFALRYAVGNKTFWDNNQGQNYCSHADSGIRVAENISLLNVEFDEHLDLAQKLLPISVAVEHALNAEKVTVHWTTDDWRSTNTTRCYLKRSRALSRGGNPNQYGIALWKGLLNIGAATEVQYSISCEAGGRVLWDSNCGHNYRIRRRPLNMLILNLHCYQEENQDFKFSQIARAIDERNIDIVCLQEVAEPWNDAEGDWPLNSANIINQRLAAPYHLTTDWSHLGFDRYREGVAILSRYPFARKAARYVSNSEDPYNIHARKVVMAQIKVPGFGPLNVYSCHVSWWDDGFEEQFDNLRTWADSNHTEGVNGTLLCGDFNIKAGGRGYELVVDTGDYQDQFLAARSPQVFAKVFDDRQADWQQTLADDHRIDYIFMKKTSRLRVTSGKVLFTERDYGRVSDHEGYLMTFEPA